MRPRVPADEHHFIRGGTPIRAHCIAVAAHEGQLEARMVGRYGHLTFQWLRQVVDPA
ncbi:hypothetical protein D3C83_253470 [compost metagenome]